MKTPTQIANEIAKLKSLLNRVPARSFFGDDNEGAIKASIEVLEVGYDVEEIEDWFEDDDYVLDSALEARDWMNDEENGEKEPPSEDWQAAAR